MIFIIPNTMAKLLQGRMTFIVGAGLVPARIARRAMTAIALTTDSGSHNKCTHSGCPYIHTRFCNSPGYDGVVIV